MTCACGVVQDHECVPYSCCLDSECAQGQACADHACITPQPGGNRPPSVPSGGECNTTSQCAVDQFCDNNVCSNVTGLCGYAVNHAWVSYQCGPEPGCPLCPQGNNCVDHKCTQSAQITVKGKNLVGGNETITVTYPAAPCASCVLALVSPSGVKTTANTDANGQFNLTLLEKGTYTVTLVKESRQGLGG